MPTPLIAGNWKMNGRLDDLKQIETIAKGVKDIQGAADALLCPPATLAHPALMLAKGTGLQIGLQNCHDQKDGAYTGDISADMIKDMGCTHVILGHSERRQGHSETDSQIRAKVKAVVAADLIPIICVGETAGEQTRGRTVARISRQLNGSLPDILKSKPFVVAYEPIWAIGTGLVPTPKQIADVHLMIRGRLTERFGQNGENTPILYGGSVKPSNAKEILDIENVNGALVGGASLKAADFLGIIKAHAFEVV